MATRGSSASPLVLLDPPLARLAPLPRRLSPSSGAAVRLYFDDVADDIVVITDTDVCFFNVRLAPGVVDVGGAEEGAAPTCRSGTWGDDMDAVRLPVGPRKRGSVATPVRVAKRHPLPSAQLDGFLVALSYDDEAIHVFFCHTAEASPVAYPCFQCSPQTLRFQHSAYPIRSFFWVVDPYQHHGQQLTCYVRQQQRGPGSAIASGTSSKLLLSASSICIDLLEVFEVNPASLHAKTPAAQRKPESYSFFGFRSWGEPTSASAPVSTYWVVLKRFSTRTDFWSYNTSCGLLLSINKQKPTVVKPFLVRQRQLLHLEKVTLEPADAEPLPMTTASDASPFMDLPSVRYAVGSFVLGLHLFAYALTQRGTLKLFQLLEPPQASSPSDLIRRSAHADPSGQSLSAPAADCMFFPFAELNFGADVSLIKGVDHLSLQVVDELLVVHVAARRLSFAFDLKGAEQSCGSGAARGGVPMTSSFFPAASPIVATAAMALGRLREPPKSLFGGTEASPSTAETPASRSSGRGNPPAALGGNRTGPTLSAGSPHGTSNAAPDLRASDGPASLSWLGKFRAGLSLRHNDSPPHFTAIPPLLTTSVSLFQRSPAAGDSATTCSPAGPVAVTVASACTSAPTSSDFVYSSGFLVMGSSLPLWFGRGRAIRSTLRGTDEEGCCVRLLHLDPFTSCVPLYLNSSASLGGVNPTPDDLHVVRSVSPAGTPRVEIETSAAESRNSYAGGPRTSLWLYVPTSVISAAQRVHFFLQRTQCCGSAVPTLIKHMLEQQESLTLVAQAFDLISCHYIHHVFQQRQLQPLVQRLLLLLRHHEQCITALEGVRDCCRIDTRATKDEAAAAERSTSRPHQSPHNPIPWSRLHQGQFTHPSQDTLLALNVSSNLTPPTVAAVMRTLRGPIVCGDRWAIARFLPSEAGLVSPAPPLGECMGELDDGPAPGAGEQPTEVDGSVKLATLRVLTVQDVLEICVDLPANNSRRENYRGIQSIPQTVMFHDVFLPLVEFATAGATSSSEFLDRSDPNGSHDQGRATAKARGSGDPPAAVSASVGQYGRAYFLQYLVYALCEYARSVAQNGGSLSESMQRLFLQLFATISACGPQPAYDSATQPEVGKTDVFFRLHQLLIYGILVDQLPTALTLINLEHRYAPALQLGLDMLSRLGATDVVVEVLLAKQKPLDAILFGYNNGVRRVPVIEILECAAAAMRRAEEDRVAAAAQQATRGVASKSCRDRISRQSINYMATYDAVVRYMTEFGETIPDSFHRYAMYYGQLVASGTIAEVP